MQQEGEGRDAGPNLAGRPAAGLHASRDSFYLTATSRRQDRSGGDPDRFTALTTVVSAVPRENHHRPRAAPPASARRAPRLDLGAAGTVPTLRQDVHHPAQLVVAVWSLQLLLSAKGLGVDVPTRGQLGAIGSAHQRPRSNAGSLHAAAMGLSKTGQPLAGRESALDLGAGRAEVFAGAHHPCLGLVGSQAYSAPGGKRAMSWPAVDELKQQIPLLEYLQAQDWTPARRIAGGRVMGVLPARLRKLGFLRVQDATNGRAADS
jgi:hypothetical protein